MTHRCLLFAVILPALIVNGCQAGEPALKPAPIARAPRVFQSSGSALEDARRLHASNDPAIAPAVAALRADADKAMNDGPFSIVNKKYLLTPTSDPHDYVSLAPYYWPDPAKPNGQPYLRKDGERNPETASYDAKPLGDMASHVYTLALAGYLTGDARYSQRAALLLRVWFFDPATRMNPNLQHAQLIRGENDGRGTGIIETNRLLNVVDAVGLLQGTAAWSDADQSKIESWFGEYVRWLRESKNGKDEAAATNNHGSWYDAQLAVYLMFLGDNSAARGLIESVKENRIAKQIEPDGRMPRELARTKSFHYSAFNLAALTLLADLGQRVDVDLWSYRSADGRSIRAALDWLVPFIKGQKKWEHQQIAAVEPELLFVPLRRAETAYGDPRYSATIAKLKINFSTDRDPLRFPAR